MTNYWWVLFISSIHVNISNLRSWWFIRQKWHFKWIQVTVSCHTGSCVKIRNLCILSRHNLFFDITIFSVNIFQFIFVTFLLFLTRGYYIRTVIFLVQFYFMYQIYKMTKLCPKERSIFKMNLFLIKCNIYGSILLSSWFIIVRFYVHLHLSFIELSVLHF